MKTVAHWASDMYWEFHINCFIIDVHYNNTYVCSPCIIFRDVYLIRNPLRVPELSVLKTTVSPLLDDITSPGGLLPHRVIRWNPVTLSVTVTLSREQLSPDCTSNRSKVRTTRWNTNDHVMQVSRCENISKELFNIRVSLWLQCFVFTYYKRRIWRKKVIYIYFHQ